jgi:hypothetical protein
LYFVQSCPVFVRFRAPLQRLAYRRKSMAFLVGDFLLRSQ